MMIEPAAHPDFDKKEIFDGMKLKLKNEKPKAILDTVKAIKKRTLTRMATNFGMTPPTPALILALAHLHREAKYTVDDAIVSSTPPACPWEAAEAYANLKDQEVNPHPGSPLTKRGGSVDSLGSLASKKSVRFAEEEAQVRVFNHELPPNEL